MVVVEKEISEVVSVRLFSLFESLRNSLVYFIQPGGNYGDHLIWKGAYKLADLAGLRYEILDYSTFQEKKFTQEDILYIHGGGGFVPWWSGTPMLILAKLAAEFQGTLILGPSTFFEDENYIRQVFRECLTGNSFDRLYLFARERLSYELIKRIVPSGAEILLDHDTALNLVRSDLIDQEAAKRVKTVYAIRSDKERSKEQGYDYLSWLDPIDISNCFEEWVAFHERADTLVTNRTHSTILGSILGIPTTMLPNSYHKNRSIWEYSLKDRGVQWQDKVDCHPMNAVIVQNNWLQKLFTSRKYRKLLAIKQNCVGN